MLCHAACHHEEGGPRDFTTPTLLTCACLCHRLLAGECSERAAISAVALPGNALADDWPLPRWANPRRHRRAQPAQRVLCWAGERWRVEVGRFRPDVDAYL